MSKIGMIGLIGVVVMGASVAAVHAAEDWDSEGQQKSKLPVSSMSKPAPAPAVASQPSQPKPATTMQTLRGSIVLRTADSNKKSGLMYLRVKSDDGRVWLLTVDSASTTLTHNGAKASSDELVEGARVETSFPRGGDAVPVAGSLSIVDQ